VAPQRPAAHPPAGAREREPGRPGSPDRQRRRAPR
jgi:hypothetical protein